MTVAEQTLETFEDDGSELAKIVAHCRKARANGDTAKVVKFDLAKGFDHNPLMDGLMTLGFSRSWTVSDDGKTGFLRVSW